MLSRQHRFDKAHWMAAAPAFKMLWNMYILSVESTACKNAFSVFACQLELPLLFTPYRGREQNLRKSHSNALERAIFAVKLGFSR